MQKLIVTLIITASLALTGCLKQVHKSGYRFDDRKLENIKVGETRKANIMRLLGTPTARSTLGKDHIWYYIHNRSEKVAFLRPEVVEQRVVAFTFDGQTLSKIEEFDESSMQKLSMAKGKTPTEGHDIGVVGQLLGNIGRFNTPEESSR